MPIDPEDLKEPEGGIHFVKSRAEPERAAPERCRWYQGCGADATCIPRLYVPASPLSPNAGIDDVSSTMFVPLCDRHFHFIRPDMLLKDEHIRAEIETVFRRKNALPSYGRAVIGRIPASDPNYLLAQKAEMIARKPQ